MEHDPQLPVNKADIIHTEDIFGVNIGALQGKTVRKKSTCVVTTIHKLPAEIIKHHSNMTLEADIMYINEIPFVITTSRSIHFCTAELIKKKNQQQLPHLLRK